MYRAPRYRGITKNPSIGDIALSIRLQKQVLVKFND
jgi:hypothetical protein